MSEVTLHADEHVHHPSLQHQFEDLGQQHEASILGMWMFLTTEILFFGGILLAYWVYRLAYPTEWAVGASLQNRTLGAVNTFVLIVSSLTMALAVREGQLGRRKGIITFLMLTLIFGGTFIVIKGVEYHTHWEEGLFPGSHFHWNEHPELASKIQLFMMFYWGLTGLHALHMVIGAGLLIWMISRAWRNHFSAEYYGPVEVMGLYWHFVDIVWIFLFAFLYLIHARALT
jgi:cytochrome c oxidase subunit III